MTTYYTLILAGYPAGDLLPGSHPATASIVPDDPRRLEPSEVFDEIEAELLARTWELASLEPRGPVTGKDGLPECADGWIITSRTPDLSAMLGPQAAQILAVITEAERVLIGNEGDSAKAIAEAYIDAANSQYPPDGQPVKHEDAAIAALNERGADGCWWEQIGSCQYGWEILALAARDLIGTTPGWTQEAYDWLTRPWVAAFGAPVHPDDEAADAAITERN